MRDTREFRIEGHKPGLLPKGNWELSRADEFDGTEIDRSKQDYRLSMMKKTSRMDKSRRCA